MIEALRQLKEHHRFHEINYLIPYAGFVGLEVVVKSVGVTTILRKRESNIGNPQLRAVHGGVVGAALEHAAIVELCYSIDLETLPRVINITINYLRPVLVEDLHIDAHIVRQGKRIANMHITAWQQDLNKLVASAHANFKLAD